MIREGFGFTAGRPSTSRVAGHRLVAFGIFLFLLALLGSLPRHSGCGPFCPPQAGYRDARLRPS